MGKKSLMSILTTIAGSGCAEALVSVDRPARKPCAEPWTSSRSTMFRKIQRWASFSFGSGAQMARSEPSRLGIVKRR